MREVRARPPVQQVMPRDLAVLQRGRPRGAGQLLLRLHLPVRPKRRPGQGAEGAVGGAEGGGEWHLQDLREEKLHPCCCFSTPLEDGLCREGCYRLGGANQEEGGESLWLDFLSIKTFLKVCRNGWMFR